MRASAADGVRRIPCGFVPGEANFQGRIASVHEHGVRLYPDVEYDDRREWALHLALWVTLLMAGVAAGLVASPQVDLLGSMIVVGVATRLAVSVWRWAWRFDAGDHDPRLVLIDRRRGSVVWIEPGHGEREVSLADGFRYCLESAGHQEACELVMGCGDQEIRLWVPKDRYQEMWLAIKAYGVEGDLPLSAADVQRMRAGGAVLSHQWRDAASPGSYWHAWVERPVWTAWSHLLWPVFVVFNVFHTCSVALSRRVDRAPGLSAEVVRRLGPVRRIDLPAAPMPSWPEVRRAVSQGLLHVIGVVPALGLMPVLAFVIWVTLQFVGLEWTGLRPYAADWMFWLVGLAAYALWATLCVRLARMASWTEGQFLDSATPWLMAFSTLLFPFALWLAAFGLDRLNVVADKGPPVAQFRGRVSGFEHWIRKGKGGTYSMTSLTISPTLGIADARPIETSVQRRHVRVGDEMCAEVHPGFFGRPWLSRLRDCSKP